ncbi:MAG: tetratricopeptide repeat protein [Chloroflexi bacterium]|nr:tetratricopeptide repeat protein [Chloroflexota bacterium]
MTLDSSATTSRIHLKVYLLDSFRIERDSQVIQLPTRKIESLLAYLVLHPESHSREKLATLLWGDSTDQQARHSLRTALGTLRKAIGDRFLLTDRETVQFNPNFPIWVDAKEMERASSESRISLYTGDLLPDFYDDWILQERERLCALYIHALLQLTQDARTRSEYTRAIEWAQKVLATDSANEKAYQHLIFCLAAQGERIAALKQFDECEKKLRDELGVEPSRETIALRDQIERQLTGSKSHEALLTNLPNPLTTFIGRKKEQQELTELLRNMRLLTITGSGGCGKTRLAIQVANRSVASFPDGVWWVDLAPLSDPAYVTQVVAQSLGAQENPNQSLEETLVNFLRGKQLLIVLDNCEHLISACAQLATRCLSACPRLQILATSRESLGITGELAWRVPSLALPEGELSLPTEQLAQYDAVRLFAERAKMFAAHWKLSDHALAVTHICRRLDGIPLAIELAAARMKVLSVDQIANRLDDRFNLLTDGSRTALPRQQTLRTTIDWSYDLLSDASRCLLQRLSVFAGGWTLEAAEFVCTGDRIAFSDILDLLTRLIDKSLVVTEERTGVVRYRMLETIRQYAQEKLSEANEDRLLRSRYLDYYVRFMLDAQGKLHGREQQQWLDRIEVENDNWRAALDWSFGEGRVQKGLRLASALMEFWEMRGYWKEGRTRIEHLLNQTEAAAETLERANALLVAAHMTGLGGAGDLERSGQYLGELVQIARRCGVDGKAVLVLGLCAWADDTFGKDPKASQAMVEEALAIALSLGDQWLMGRVLFMRGWLLVGTVDYASALEAFESSLANFKSVGDAHWIARLVTHIASIHAKQGHFALAHQELEQVLLYFRQVKAKREIVYVVNQLGETERAQGNYESAKKNYSEVLKLAQELGSKLGICVSFLNLGFVALHQGDLDSAKSSFINCFALETEINGKGTFALMGFASLAVMEKQSHRAVRLFAVVTEQLESGDKRTLSKADKMEYQHYLLCARDQLDEGAFNVAWEEGKQMTLEQTIKYVLKE